MSRFGGVFAGEECVLMVAFGGFVVVVTFGWIIARRFLAGTVRVFIFVEEVVAVGGIVIGIFLAGHAFGALICGASFGNHVAVAITVGAMVILFRVGDITLIAVGAFGDFVRRRLFISESAIRR
jgi:hypothetical protein